MLYNVTQLNPTNSQFSIVYTIYSNFNLSQYINKVTRKTGQLQLKILQSVQNYDRESQDQGMVFLRKQFTKSNTETEVI